MQIFYCVLMYNKRHSLQIGEIKMEQQKIAQNILPNSQSILNIADISNTYQKTLRSLHNISSSNINSKSKLSPGPQFVISYNFQNDPNCQVRTHNLLIGLDQVVQSNPKKNTFRKNALLRANNFLNSHSNLRNSRNDSEHFRNKLIQVRSNQILSSKHKNQDTTAQSFYTKNDKTKLNPQIHTHSNTFWNNEKTHADEGKKNHEKYINSNVMKIAHRKSVSKNKHEMNVYTNSIQKISRNKISDINKNVQKQNQSSKVKFNQLYEPSDADVLEKDQTSRVGKPSNQQDQYNQKLEKILRKVKGQVTRESLKQAYIKHDSNLEKQQAVQSSGQNSRVKVSPNSFSGKVSQTGQNKFGKQSISHANNHFIAPQKISQEGQNSNQQFDSSNCNQNELNSKQQGKIDQLYEHNQITNPLRLNKVDPFQRSVLSYQTTLIEKENAQKPKRKYQQLLKNTNTNKSNKKSLAQEFHKIQSQNQNEVGSSKKQSKFSIVQNNLPDKSVDYSINDHFNQNLSNAKQNQPNQLAENKEKVFLEQLQFMKEKSNGIQKDKLNDLQKSIKRSNYHAPTTVQRSSINHKHDRQRLNSSLDYKSDHVAQEKDQNFTKRKVPADYKEFLRMLSQENERKKSIQEFQRQRELSLCATKTSRFQNLEAQKQHIQRVLTPIKNSFMEERRKRLSDQRKSKKRQRKQDLKNLDGSIIESDSQASDEYGRNSRKRKQLTKLKNKSLQQKSNASMFSNSQGKNFKESLYNSIEKTKGDLNRSLNKQSSNQRKVQLTKPKAKLNSFQLQRNNNDLSDEYEQGQNNIGNDQKDSSKVQKLTGMKIPEKAIERTNSKLNRMRNMPQNNINNQNNHHSKNNQQHQNNSYQKNVAKGGQIKNSTNKFSKNNTANNAKNQRNPQRESQSLNKEKENTKNLGQNKNIKPTDIRVAKQKQRNFKNWKNGQLGQKKQKDQSSHVRKDKKVNQKDWKQTQKTKKDKIKVEKNINETDEQVETPNQKTTPVMKEKSKQSKKVKHVRHSQNSQEQNDSSHQKDQSNDDSNSDEAYNIEKSSNAQEVKEKSQENHVVKNQSIQNKSSIQKKQNIPSIHQSVQKDENNCQKQKNNSKTNNQPSNKASSSLVASNRASLESAQNSNSKPQNALSQQNQKTEKDTNKQSALNQKDELKKQIKEEKKKEMIQNVLENQEMQQNGFMEISQSKFEIYNHESEKSLASIGFNQVQQMDLKQLDKRAQIVKFLYSLPSQYQEEVDKFLPNQNQQRILTQSHFARIDAATFKEIKNSNLKNGLEQLSIFDHLNLRTIDRTNKTKQNGKQPSKGDFLRKLFEPFPNLNGQIGVWMYCVGVWRLITVHKGEISIQNQKQTSRQSFLLSCLQKAFGKALEKYYFNMRINELKPEQILKMLTGLRVSILAKIKGNSQKIFREIEYNTRKSHIIRAISSSQSKFSKETINCVRKIQNTPTGQKVLQIVSTSMKQIQLKPKYFWIKEDKFLQFFTSFTIISRRNTDSYWTNDSIDIKNQNKAVYMIDSTQKHTSGSITLYPLDSDFQSNRQKCTIAFYKEIQPQVLKLVGKAMQKIPENQETVHTSKLYFEFNIKGTYFVFLQLQNGLYNVSIESNTSQTKLDFIEFVKKQTMKNDQCEYVEIDKIFKKKPNINTFQNSSQFKQLLNFMKKTSPQVYHAK